MSIILTPPGGTGGSTGTGTTYELECDQDTTTGAAYVTLCDITGPGCFYDIIFKCLAIPGGTEHIKVTIDGYIQTFDFIATATLGIYRSDLYNSNDLFYITTGCKVLDLWFKNEFKVEFKSDGTETVFCKVKYSKG